MNRPCGLGSLTAGLWAAEWVVKFENTRIEMQQLEMDAREKDNCCVFFIQIFLFCAF